MKKVYRKFISIHTLFLTGILFLLPSDLFPQGIRFNRDFSPAEGMVRPQEKPCREELCLNGSWDFQPVAVPKEWKYGTGIPPELTAPQPDKWETVKLKIPSPWNVNEWGGGSKVGLGTDKPYAPSSVYYPSYPPGWGSERMGWLRRNFIVPASFAGKRILLHFEAVIGDCVILVNGQKAGEHFGAYLPFETDITDLVRDDQPNELMVGIRHRRLFDKTSPQYKYFRSTYPPGSNTDNLVGIWQDVFLLAVPPVRITDVYVKPWVDRDTLEFEVKMINQTQKTATVSLSGSIREWINKAGKDVLSAPEIKWTNGRESLRLAGTRVSLRPGESATLTLGTKVSGKLKQWGPGHPDLYTMILKLADDHKSVDCKTERFGWRQFGIKGTDFVLNGAKIQCFADIQHPFGAYVCSRRFAWAWYRMIRDFGGNCVRLHAQPWPRLYYDLADEMGLMVLDEGALFGSSLSLNFEEEITWKRTEEHLDALVLRDRNHPSVIGWSAGNELFAIPLYNKPSPEISKSWDEKIVKLAMRPALLDPTRPFVTDDGDEDMYGNLAVWSKHFGHGLTLNRLPKDPVKPLVIGESGATYYGKPKDLYQFAGEKPYESYYGRNEALAIDVYQNVVKMARPLLAYYSPSEVCWFGLEHQNLGYHDYSRLPVPADGVFAGTAFKEGKPGYQMERIPPYATTFNPGLDPELPLYKPLPMFEALKAALSKDSPKPCKWDSYQPQEEPPKPAFAKALYAEALFAGMTEGPLARQLSQCGIRFAKEDAAARLLIIDGQDLSEELITRLGPAIERIQANGGLIWILLADRKPSAAVTKLLPWNLEMSNRSATSLTSNRKNEAGRYFSLPGLYFSELEGDRRIMKQGLTGELVKHASVILEAANIDWSLFNQVAENRKCAQVVLYERLQKPPGAACISFPVRNSAMVVSTLDYRIFGKETQSFWKNLCQALQIEVNAEPANHQNSKENKKHDLLLDGPVRQE